MVDARIFSCFQLTWVPPAFQDLFYGVALPRTKWKTSEIKAKSKSRWIMAEAK